MATVTSPEEVCNLALDLLRQSEKVTSISTPESEVEDLAARWYDVTRRSVLRAFFWNFARYRTTLSRNVVDPVSGYADAYNLPVDYLELVFIGENYNEDYATDYSVEGGQILIDNDGDASLDICYIRDVTEVPKFDACFINLLVGELAVVFANSLTGINKGMKEVNAFRDRAEVKARAKNGQENPVKTRNVSPLLTRRQCVTSGGGFDGTHVPL